MPASAQDLPAQQRPEILTPSVSLSHTHPSLPTFCDPLDNVHTHFKRKASVLCPTQSRMASWNQGTGRAAGTRL